ncbi:MAG: hypothetical protein ACHQ50_01800 [Fimbriimonadales bacterium]
MQLRLVACELATCYLPLPVFRLTYSPIHLFTYSPIRRFTLEEFIIRGLLTDIAPATAAASTKVAFSGQQRYGITIQAYGSPVYVKVVKKGASDPSASSALYTWPIPAGSSLDKKLGCNLDVWVQTAGNYSAQEWV